MARPTDLTPEVQEVICRDIRAGLYLETAASRGGITRQTLLDWLKRGAKEKGSIYEGFSEAVEKAEADAEALGILRIRKAGVEIWQAEAWYMERRFNKRWGRPHKPDPEAKEAEGPTDPETAFLSLLEKLRTMPPEFQQRALNALATTGDDGPEEDAP